MFFAVVAVVVLLFVVVGAVVAKPGVAGLVVVCHCVGVWVKGYGKGGVWGLLGLVGGVMVVEEVGGPEDLLWCEEILVWVL